MQGQPRGGPVISRAKSTKYTIYLNQNVSGPATSRLYVKMRIKGNRLSELTSNVSLPHEEGAYVRAGTGSLVVFLCFCVCVVSFE
jgi:hypothetical protein